MFTHHCTACDREQLIFASMVTGVTTSDHGPVLAFTCWCGAEQAAPASLSERHEVDAAA